MQWEVLPSALGHFPIQVLQVSHWKLLHFGSLQTALETLASKGGGGPK